MDGSDHTEGKAIFERYLEVLKKNMSGVMVAFKPSSRGEKLEIIDVDASIWSTIFSVLTRTAFEKGSCVDFDVIKKGYIAARTNRREFIYDSKNENVNYALYHLAQDGQYIKVASKGEGEDHLTIINQNVFDECLRIPGKEEMKEIACTVITDELIQSLEIPSSKAVLHQWLGYTVEQALSMLSTGSATVPGGC